MNTERFSGIVQVLILIAIAGMAGAASWSHVHDWTMHYAPAGTGSWFGWANAVISELTPIAAGIEIRKRHRKNQVTGYPVFLVIAAAALSLSAQVSQARPSFGGWVSIAVPALAFLALVKLILSTPHAKKEAPAWNQNQPGTPATTSTGTTAQDGTASPSEATVPSAAPGPDSRSPDPTPQTPAPTSTTTGSPASAASSDPTSASADSARTPEPDPPAEPAPAPPGPLLMSGRMAAFSHQQATGQPITPGQLADRMNITEDESRLLLRHLDVAPPTPVTTANGSTVNGSRP